MPPVCPWMPFAVSFTSKPTTGIALPQPRNPIITADNLAEAYLQMYDPRRDSEALKTHPEQFEKLPGRLPATKRKRCLHLYPKVAHTFRDTAR